MLIILSLILAIILNNFLAIVILKFLSLFIDLSIFSNISSIELLFLVIPLFVILPTLVIYTVLRKFNFDQKLKDMKVTKIILTILIIVYIIYIIILLLSTNIKGGGITFAIKLIFSTYVLPIMILLFFVSMGMIIQKLLNSGNIIYSNKPLSNKEISFLKYIGGSSIAIILIILINPYGNIFKNKQGNNRFQELCKDAKTTIFKKVTLNTVFLYTNFQRRYCKIDSFNRYSSFDGGGTPLSKNYN